MEYSAKYHFFMSELTHVKEIKETEKINISVVYNERSQSYCILRICKNRDLSTVCATLRKIRNPNAVVVYDYVYENGNTYILEENVAGRTIEECINHDGFFLEDRTAQIIIDVCNALEPLHKEAPPVVHNDINPSNIKIRDDGSVKLFDFDISRLYIKGQNQNTMLFGTEEYASPEHFGYGQSEPRTDIYCLGVTMHKMLTGKGLSSEHRMIYNGKLKKIIQKCLEFDPKNRYASVQHLKQDLEKFLARKKRIVQTFLRCLAISVFLSAIISCMCLWLGKQADEPTGNGPNQLSTSPTTNHNTAPTNNTTTNPGTGETTHSIPSSSNGETPVPENNHSRNTAWPIVRDESINGSVTSDNANWYKFTTSSNASLYRISLFQFNAPANMSFPYLYVALYDSIGIKLDEFYIWSDDDDKYGYIDLLLDTNTEYFIKIYLGGRFNSGDYEIVLTEMACDAGSSKDSAIELVLGDNHVATMDSTLSDWYMFKIAKAGKYRITIHNIDVGCRIALDVEYADGGFVFTTLTCPNEDNRSNWFNAKAGTIYLEVSSYNDNPIADGQYIIVIEEFES